MTNKYLLIKHLTKSIPQQQIKVRVIHLWRELMDQNLNENANYTVVFMDEQVYAFGVTPFSYINHVTKCFIHMFL